MLGASLDLAPQVGASVERALMRAVYKCAYRVENGPGNDAELFLGIGYAAKALASILALVDAQLVLGVQDAVQVAVGWDSGDTHYMGKLTRDGFIAIPRLEAIAATKDERRRWAAFRSKEDEKLKATEPRFRRFRHRDGRTWSILVTPDMLRLELTDSDGDAFSRRRLRKGDEDMERAGTTLVNDQLANGFVEVK